MSLKTDPAVAALAWALKEDPSLDRGGSVLCLRARADGGLEQFRGRLTAAHDFKPQVDRLTAAGWPVVAMDAPQKDFSMVIVLAERQREQTLADFARAFDALAPGGLMIASVPNDWGAARYEDHLAELAGEVLTTSKSKCRIFWTYKTEELDQDMLAEWRNMAVLRKQKQATPLPEGRSFSFLTRPGQFSWAEPDAGSVFLLQHLPAQLFGRVADVGSGWGLLSATALARHPDITHVDLYEADRGSLSAAQRNISGVLAAMERPTPALSFLWTDVTQGLREGYDFILMNPPFHQDRSSDPMLGIRFIAACVQALKPGGTLILVANKNLPYERFLREGLPKAQVAAEWSSYKILIGSKPTLQELAEMKPVEGDDADIMDQMPDGPRPHAHSPEATGHRPRKGKRRRPFRR